MRLSLFLPSCAKYQTRGIIVRAPSLLLAAGGGRSRERWNAKRKKRDPKRGRKKATGPGPWGSLSPITLPLRPSWQQPKESGKQAPPSDHAPICGSVPRFSLLPPLSSRHHLSRDGTCSRWVGSDDGARPTVPMSSAPSAAALACQAADDLYLGKLWSAGGSLRSGDG